MKVQSRICPVCNTVHDLPLCERRSEEIRKAFVVGQRVKAVRMAKDSFYKQVIGTVTEIRNGYVEIDATEVMSKWDNAFERHPTSCRTAAKLADVVAL